MGKVKHRKGETGISISSTPHDRFLRQMTFPSAWTANNMVGYIHTRPGSAMQKRVAITHTCVKDAYPQPCSHGFHEKKQRVNRQTRSFRETNIILFFNRENRQASSINNALVA